MPRKRANELVIGRFFTWKLFLRSGVYWADGRTNRQPAGRQSLATKDHVQALENLRHLDTVKAVELGLADECILDEGAVNQLSLDDGVDLYRAHVQRPRVTRGAGPKSWKRYRAVFDKAIPFFKETGIRFWNQLRKHHLESYAAWLDGEGYAYRTEFLELTTLKQANNHLIEEGHLPADCRIRLPLTKPTGTDTYCWRPEEVVAMLSLCERTPDLNWLGDVLTALAYTGMRISELASLRWSDIDLNKNLITLKDETASGHRPSNRPTRHTKSRRSRCFPIHDELRQVLLRRPHGEDGLVFRGPRGGLLSPDVTRRTLIRDVLTPLTKEFPGEGGELSFKDRRR